MNNSLDKLISNDELLTYICLILGIFNTFLMSIVITGIKHSFSIYIFLLFEAIFLIFIVYFILKKKDVYNKDDDIKYDWYFYLRISIIILVFFNFSLYIYNITNDSSTNPRKNGGGGSLSSFVSSSSRSNRVAPAAPAAPTNIENEIKIKMLQEELEPLVSALTNDINKLNKGEIGAGSTDLLRKKIGNINAEISKLRASTRASRAPAREPARAPARAPRETSRAPARALRETSRAPARVPARVPAREASREASNRVVQDPFPYQNSVSTTNPELTTRDIFRSDLPANGKISLWGKLEKEKKEKGLKNK